MQDPRFSDSVLGGPFTVAGRALRPFSYWHLFQMESADLPFLEGITPTEPMAAVQALDTAIRICKTRYPKTPKPRGKLSRKLAVWRLRHIDKGLEALSEYLNFYLQGPEFWTTSQGGSHKGQMPRALAGVSALMMMGRTEAAAWDCPVGLGEWFKAARAAHDGADLDFVEPLTPEMEGHIDALRTVMPELIKALRHGGDAIAPARKLANEGMLTQQTLKMVEQWQTASGKTREELGSALLAKFDNSTRRG